MVTAQVSWPEAPLTESLVKKALQNLKFQVEILPSNADSPVQIGSTSQLLQWSAYDLIDHELTSLRRNNVLSSSYTFRKALIRKHFLSRTIHSYTTKYPDSTIMKACPETYELELSFADELEEMWSDELWELGEKLRNDATWWILKPGMSDRGMGIRLFNNKQDLQEILESFESENEDEQSDVEGGGDGTTVMLSQLRHFVVQEYVLNPLLLDPCEVHISGLQKPEGLRKLQGHKFHLRAYCVSTGAIQLYLYGHILALFSGVPYAVPVAKRSLNKPSVQVDLKPHLTNTSIQQNHSGNGVCLLTELIGCHVLSGIGNEKLLPEDVAEILKQMTAILAETFKAALQNPVHFQPLPNAFELYGVDFLISHVPERPSGSSAFHVKILELNAEPAIELTGPRLSWILDDLFMATGKICVEPFFSEKSTVENKHWAVGEVKHNMIKCLDEQVRGV